MNSPTRRARKKMRYSITFCFVSSMCVSANCQAVVRGLMYVFLYLREMIEVYIEMIRQTVIGYIIGRRSEIVIRRAVEETFYHVVARRERKVRSRTPQFLYNAIKLLVYGIDTFPKFSYIIGFHERRNSITFNTNIKISTKQ